MKHSATHILMGLIDEKSITADLDRTGYKKMGVIVKRFGSFDGLVKSLKQKNIDLIVLNLDYKNIDAKNILQSLKSGPYKDIPCVVTSVQTNKKLQTSALESGADLFIEKPLPRAYFIEKLKQLLEQKTRENTRLEIHAKATFSIDDEIFNCEIADLSETGAFISFPHQLSDGAVFKITLSLRDQELGASEISCTGELVRNIYSDGTDKQQVGIGVRFTEFQGKSKRLLERYVAKLTHNDIQYAYYL